MKLFKTVSTRCYFTNGTLGYIDNFWKYGNSFSAAWFMLDNSWCLESHMIQNISRNCAIPWHVCDCTRTGLHTHETICICEKFHMLMSLRFVFLAQYLFQEWCCHEEFLKVAVMQNNIKYLTFLTISKCKSYFWCTPYFWKGLPPPTYTLLPYHQYHHQSSKEFDINEIPTHKKQ